MIRANYDTGNEITYNTNTEVLKSNLYDYNDAYIFLVRDDITVTAAHVTQLAFKNYAPFTKCFTKIDRATIDDVEDLDLIMPMYNLIEYSSNYPETKKHLWIYPKDEATDFDADIANNSLKSFKYKTKLLGNTVAKPANAANGILKNVITAVPLKYLSNFWRSLELWLINCKVELKLKWTKYCALSATANENESDSNNSNNASNIIFTIKDTKLYAPVVTSARDNRKLSKPLSKGFER